MKVIIKLSGLLAFILAFVAGVLALETWKFSVYAAYFGWHPSHLVLAMIWVAQLLLVLTWFTVCLVASPSRQPVRRSVRR